MITGGNGGNNSLFGVLNQCKTKMGRYVLCVNFSAIYDMSWLFVVSSDQALMTFYLTS